MSKKFKKTLKEKYGAKGDKGRAGELFFYNFYTKKGYYVHDKEDDIPLQTAGVDFIVETVKGGFTVDVKNNLVVDDEDLNIVVEVKPDGWLFNPDKLSEFISHVNPSHGIIVTYRRSKMQNFITENFWDVRSDIIYLPTNMLPFAKIEYAFEEL